MHGTPLQRTCEFYSPDTNSWSPGPSMIDARSNFTATQIGGSIYVIGGYTGQDTISNVERFDLTTRTWHQSSQINFPRSALKCCVLRDLNNMRQYLDEGAPQVESTGNPWNGWRSQNQRLVNWISRPKSTHVRFCSTLHSFQIIKIYTSINYWIIYLFVVPMTCVILSF